MHKGWRLLLLPPTALLAPAYAHEYLNLEQAQSILFPGAEKFEKKVLNLTKDQRDLIKKESGVRQRSQTQIFWRVEKKGIFEGWMLIDEVIGKHEYIGYAAGISPEGKILGIEIMNYRETHGGQVREDSWRSHFKNKTLADPFKLDQDIPNISGATLSCRNLTDGVKRLLVMHKHFIAHD